jgi:uncharacterized Zn finger protein
MVRRGRWDDPWQRFPASKPLPAKDGIATTKQRGAMAERWWSKRFVEVLDDYGLGARMQRGRRYARTGQLLSFDVHPGHLLAQVQGSRATPYLVTVGAPVTSDAQWAEVDSALASRVKFAARLLAGDVPPELEGVFADAGVALLPARWSDIVARCTCPDIANPCKHIAAVLYVFADRLDDDPWLLLEWRGRTRNQILEPLVSRANVARIPEGAASGERRDHVPGDDVRDTAAEVAPWWPLDPALARLPAGAGLHGTGIDQLLSVDPPDPPDGVLVRLDELDVKIRESPVTGLFLEAYRIVTTDDRP